jgi:murein peptide amidase A
MSQVSHTSSPVRDYTGLAARVVAAAQPPAVCRVYGQQTTPDASVSYDLLIVRVPVPRSRFKVLINGGTHGDEPAGAEAVVRFLEGRRYERWPEVEFTITPCTNPWGYVHDKREGPFGVDLNRSFRRATRTAPQVSLLKQALARRKFDMFIDCHEDVDATGLYVFAPNDLGRSIVDAVRTAGPIQPGDMVDGEIPLDRGVVNLDAPRFREGREMRNTWPLPLYIARFHRQLAPPSSARSAALENSEGAPPEDTPFTSSATVETPTSLALDQRVSMHLRAIDAALATLYRK